MATVLISHAQQFDTPQDALAHYGVKGMKWGVRKNREGSGKKSIPDTRTDAERRRSRNKKIAIGVAVLLLVAAIAYTAYHLKKHGTLPFSSLRKGAKAAKTMAKGKAEVAKVLKEPTEVIHLARGKHTGLTWLKKGGTEDYFSVFDKAGLNQDVGRGFFERLSDGKIAARMPDPGNRFDFAGRPITHDIVVPKSMTNGINNMDDIREKIWPTLKDTYDEFYRQSEGRG